MRYAFFGTTDFSVTLFECLVRKGFRPDVVVANPDRPAGRKRILTPPPTKIAAEQERVAVFQPESLDAGAIERLRRIGADFFILADYGKILPPPLLGASRLGVIGVHASLLPRYRGPSPMQTVILNGDVETGVTLYILDEKVDEGPILAQEQFPLLRQTFLELRKESALRACEMLSVTLPRFVAQEIKPKPQDRARATYTKKFASEDAFIDPKNLEEAQRGQEAAIAIDRKIRALNPEPGAWTIAGKWLMTYGISPGADRKRVKLLEAEIKNSELVLKKIQLEGKNPKVIF